MKKLLFALVALTMVAIASCSKDEDGTQKPTDENANELVGKSVTVSGYMNSVDTKGKISNADSVCVVFSFKTNTMGELYVALYNDGQLYDCINCTFGYDFNQGTIDASATGSDKTIKVNFAIDSNGITFYNNGGSYFFSTQDGVVQQDAKGQISQTQPVQITANTMEGTSWQIFPVNNSMFNAANGFADSLAFIVSFSKDYEGTLELVSSRLGGSYSMPFSYTFINYDNNGRAYGDITPTGSLASVANGFMTNMRYFRVSDSLVVLSGEVQQGMTSIVQDLEAGQRIFIPVILEKPVSFAGMTFQDTNTVLTFTSATAGSATINVTMGQKSPKVPMSITATVPFTYTATGSLLNKANVELSLNKSQMTINPSQLQSIAANYIPNKLSAKYTFNGTSANLAFKIEIQQPPLNFDYNLEWKEEH